MRAESVLGPGGIPWVVEYRRKKGFYNRNVYDVYIAGRYRFKVTRVLGDDGPMWEVRLTDSESEAAFVIATSRTKAVRRAMQQLPDG